MASDIKDDTRKRAMLLYQAGPQVSKVFKTLSNTGEDKDCKVALKKLNEYFEPQKIYSMKHIFIVKLVKKRKKLWLTFMSD